jgi:hypothetical protein
LIAYIKDGATVSVMHTNLNNNKNSNNNNNNNNDCQNDYLNSQSRSGSVSSSSSNIDNENANTKCFIYHDNNNNSNYQENNNANGEENSLNEQNYLNQNRSKSSNTSTAKSNSNKRKSANTNTQLSMYEEGVLNDGKSSPKAAHYQHKQKKQNVLENHHQFSQATKHLHSPFASLSSAASSPPTSLINQNFLPYNISSMSSRVQFSSSSPISAASAAVSASSNISSFNSSHNHQNNLMQSANIFPFLQQMHSHSETIQEASARLLFMSIKWCKSLPSFITLPLRDQVNKHFLI